MPNKRVIFFENQILKNTFKESQSVKTILYDTILNRAKNKLFYFKMYDSLHGKNWEISDNIFSNKTQTKFILYVSENSCHGKNCTADITKFYAEKINNVYFFSSGESLVILAQDFNWPEGKQFPFSMLSKIARNDRLPVYLKQKHWWNPFDFEINEDLFEYNFPMTGKSDEEKIKYYTKDWAFGERQPR